MDSRNSLSLLLALPVCIVWPSTLAPSDVEVDVCLSRSCRTRVGSDSRRRLRSYACPGVPFHRACLCFLTATSFQQATLKFTYHSCVSHHPVAGGLGLVQRLQSYACFLVPFLPSLWFPAICSLSEYHGWICIHSCMEQVMLSMFTLNAARHQVSRVLSLSASRFHSGHPRALQLEARLPASPCCSARQPHARLPRHTVDGVLPLRFRVWLSVCAPVPCLIDQTFDVQVMCH